MDTQNIPIVKGRGRGRGRGAVGRGRGRGRGRVAQISPTLSNLVDANKAAETEEGADSKKPRLETQTELEDSVCPVCLDQIVHELKLECGHKYCFLCAKGLSESGNPTCSLCRRSIPFGFFKKPQQATSTSVPSKTEADNDMCWFYEGGNGWWKFEERHNEEIEKAFVSGHRDVDMLICGQIYHLDLRSMVQFKKDFPRRIRRIKRDLSKAPAIGIAGLTCQ